MILVAEDDKTLSQLLRTLLEEAGYAVRVAHDGQSAYKYLRDPECRVALLDIRLPKISGAELLILMAAEGIRVPVIVIAGFPDFDEEEIKQFPNVRRFFQKPFYPEDIVNAVRQILAE